MQLPRQAGALLQDGQLPALVIQMGVLDGYRNLITQTLNHQDILGRKRAGPGMVDIQCADNLFVQPQWHDQL